MNNFNINTIKQIINQSKKLADKKIITRHTYPDWFEKATKTDLIKIITGFRRVGKSTLLKLFVKKLVTNNKIPEQNIFYINFELDIAQDINTVKKLRKTFELFKSISKSGFPVYVILDEIQKIKFWESFVRSIHENGQYQIFVSGSNSNLLSAELSTALSGRYISLHVLPFDFIEYTKLKSNVPIEKLTTNFDYFDPENDIYNLVHDYIENGAIPETIGLSNEIKSNYIENLFNKVIIDDIGKRYLIEKMGILKDLYKFMLGNISGITSSQKLAKSLKVSPNTVLKYIGYYINSFALYPVSKYAVKLYSVFDNTRKYYTVDNSLFSILSKDIKFSQKLENQVFLKLKRDFSSKTILFGRDYQGHEIDFLIKYGEKKFTKIQVTNILHDGNAKRELGNLIYANKHLSGKNILIYWNDARTNREIPKKIEMIPATKFLTAGI